MLRLQKLRIRRIVEAFGNKGWVLEAGFFYFMLETVVLAEEAGAFWGVDFAGWNWVPSNTLEVKLTGL